MRRTLFLIASVIVSAAFLWLALRNVDLGKVADSIRQANLGWLFLAFFTMFFGLFFRAVRWRALLDGKLQVWRAFHILNIGFLLNALPLRAGEFARMLLATREKVPLATAATSVVVERLIDTLLVVVTLVIAISRLPNAPQEITGPTTAFGLAVIAAFVVLIIFARFPKAGHWTIHFAQGIIPPLKRLPLDNMLDHVLDGLKPLTHLASAAKAIFWTLVSWGVSLTTVYCTVRALGIESTGVDLWMLSVLALTLASFSIAIPVSVASIGPFQAAVVVAGQAVGLAGTASNDALALSLGFLFHGVNIIGYCIWGGLGLLLMGVSLGDVLRRDRPTAAGATPAEATTP